MKHGAKAIIQGGQLRSYSNKSKFPPPHMALGLYTGLPFTHIYLRLFFPHLQYQRESREILKHFDFCPFADEISLRWVPVAGISVNSSCPGAKHPILQAPIPLSDSSRLVETMAMPARAFDFYFFLNIPQLSHCFIDHQQTSFCSSASRRLYL